MKRTELDHFPRLKVTCQILRLIQSNWDRHVSNPEEMTQAILGHPNIAIVEAKENEVFFV